MSHHTTIICDDTDIFILLLYHSITALRADVHVFIEATSRDRKIISFNETLKKLDDQGINVQDLQASMPCLDGTVDSLFGIDC